MLVITHSLGFHLNTEITDSILLEPTRLKHLVHGSLLSNLKSTALTDEGFLNSMTVLRVVFYEHLSLRRSSDDLSAKLYNFLLSIDFSDSIPNLKRSEQCDVELKSYDYVILNLLKLAYKAHPKSLHSYLSVEPFGIERFGEFLNESMKALVLSVPYNSKSKFVTFTSMTYLHIAKICRTTMN